MVMLTTKVEPLERDLKLLFPDPFSDVNRSKALSTYARQVLNETLRKYEAPPDYIQTVDGIRDAALETVRPDGLIVFEFLIHNEMFRWIADALEAASPVGRQTNGRDAGTYSRSHILVADNDVVSPDNVTLGADEYYFVSTVPYARKIELPRAQSKQAPKGVYEVIATMSQRRFSKLAHISYSFRSINTGAIDAWARKTNLTSRERKRMDSRDRASWLRRQPAIVIRMK